VLEFLKRASRNAPPCTCAKEPDPVQLKCISKFKDTVSCLVVVAPRQPTLLSALFLRLFDARRLACFVFVFRFVSELVLFTLQTWVIYYSTNLQVIHTRMHMYQ